MDESLQNLINLDAMEIAAIKRRVPATISIPTLEQDDLSRTIITNRHDYVLKPNYESRGVGVLVGRYTNEATWIQALKSYGLSGGVAQEVIDTETRLVLEAPTETSGLRSQVEFFGADVFFFGVAFAGIVGRSHTDPVINVGNGGREIPTLIVSGYRKAVLDLSNSNSEPT